MSTGIKVPEMLQKEAERAFGKLDKRSEGHIKVGDVADCLKDIGNRPKAEWMEKMDDSIDQEGTGYVEFSEFMEILKAKLKADEDERELRDVFRVLDKERKGEVNVSVIRWILKNLGDDMSEEEIDDMIADVDTDASGWVDFEEFSKLMMS